MKRYTYQLQAICCLMLPLLFMACGGNTTQADTAAVVIEDEIFEPAKGTSLQTLAQMPEVKWSFDTVKGVCGPDSLRLWVAYSGKDYATNVYGVEGKYVNLTTSGNKKVIGTVDDVPLAKADFTSNAMVVDLGMDRDAYREYADSMYYRNLNEVIQLVNDFFTSHGMVKYMSESMASTWQNIYSQAELEGGESPNPFNGETIVEFEPGSILVNVTDASKGVTEVSAYCLDSYTLGHPGWAYWTVRVCREGGAYKIKSSPMIHRKFAS